MSLKAILFDFNGVIINDEPIHKELIEEILLSENLRPQESEFKELCLGRSDRAALKDIFSHRGRFLSEEYLNRLIKTKAQKYREKLAELDNLPIYEDVEDFLLELDRQGIVVGLVTGGLREEVEIVLQRANLYNYFQAIVTGDEITTSKPEPDGYLLAVEKLDRQYPYLKITPAKCLAIEDTFVGITAAKNAGIQVVGVANTYPFHMLQRKTDWTVDYLWDLDLQRIKQVFLQREEVPSQSGQVSSSQP
jgi:HAD superfamily hydrolase (TIGR01509 family)